MSDVPLIRTRVFGTTSRTWTFPDAALIEIRYEPAAFLPTHAHESSMFIFTVAGSFEETFAHRQRICRPRQFVYRPAGERHSQRFGNGGATCFAIELAEMAPVGLEGADGRLDLSGQPTLFAMRLYDEFARPSTDTALVVEETVAMLTAASGRRERAPHWLGRAVDMIEARLATTIRLRDLAAEVRRHPVHVSRCFRERFACDVAEYVRRRRVHESCRWIRDTRESLSAIAAATGFSDQSHMGRAFRHVMGCSPGSYARRRVPADNHHQAIS